MQEFMIEVQIFLVRYMESIVLYLSCNGNVW